MIFGQIYSLLLKLARKHFQHSNFCVKKVNLVIYSHVEYMQDIPKPAFECCAAVRCKTWFYLLDFGIKLEVVMAFKINFACTFLFVAFFVSGRMFYELCNFSLQIFKTTKCSAG